MNALLAPQRSEDWFAARVGRVTGSRAGAILGLNPYQSRDDVMREMVREYFGAEKEFTGNAATEWGTEHEAEALSRFEAITGEMVDEAGLIIHPEHDWLAASPDGLIGDTQGLEIKAPYSGKLKPIEDQPHYMAQIQLCLAVTGRDEWHYFAWTPTDYLHEIVKRDPEWIETHLPAFEAFVAEYIATISEEEAAAPHLEPLVRDMSEDEQWQQHASEYREIDAEMKDLKKRQEAIKKALVKMAGEKKASGCGLSVSPVTRKGSIDAEAMAIAAGINPDDYRKPESTSWTVRVEKRGAA